MPQLTGSPVSSGIHPSIGNIRIGVLHHNQGFHLTGEGCAENALSTLRRADTGKKLELLFATWDADHDGYIDIPDFAKGLQKMQPSTDEIHLEFVADAAVKALPALSADVQR